MFASIFRKENHSDEVFSFGFTTYLSFTLDILIPSKVETLRFRSERQKKYTELPLISFVTPNKRIDVKSLNYNAATADAIYCV